MNELKQYRCPGCGYLYDEEAGDTHEGLSPGTPIQNVPEDLSCPDCGVRDFLDFEECHDA